MSEYESALIGIVRVMLDAVIDMGAPKSQLAQALKSLKDSAQRLRSPKRENCHSACFFRA